MYFDLAAVEAVMLVTAWFRNGWFAAFTPPAAGSRLGLSEPTADWGAGDHGGGT